VTGSFHGGSWAAGAFILFKGGEQGPKSAKQAQIGMTGLPTILCFAGLRRLAGASCAGWDRNRSASGCI